MPRICFFHKIGLLSDTVPKRPTKYSLRFFDLKHRQSLMRVVKRQCDHDSASLNVSINKRINLTVTFFITLS